MVRLPSDGSGQGGEMPWSSDSAILALYHYVLHLCRRRLRDAEQVQDATQEVMLRLFMVQTRYDPNCSLHGWARSITHNVLREFIRYQSLHSIRTVPEQVLDKEAPENELPERAALLTFLGTLTDHQRRALELRYFEGRSLSEIAAEMRCQQTTAKVHLARGKKRLRQILQSEKRQLR